MMRLQRLVIRLSRNAHPALVLAVGIALLTPLDMFRSRLREEAVLRAADARELAPQREAVADAVADLLALRNLKRRDIEGVKQGLSSLTKSKRDIYEAGLSLQEEKRLLDKQWEIMTVYLMIDPAELKAHVMRGEQSLESFPLLEAPRAIPAGTKVPPGLIRIVSKERFAHPERGSYTEKDGRLQWNPPQVGAPSRDSALGEFVIFTDSTLILHGPPAKKEEHEAYPHYCLGLSLSTAHKLYAESFIGTKILIKKPPEAKNK